MWSQTPPEFVKYLMTAAIVVFGAVVHATVQLKVARDTEDHSFTRTDFLILIPIAIFSGMVFAFMGDIFFQDPRIVNLCASIGAFLGIAGINKVSEAILEFIIIRAKK